MFTRLVVFAFFPVVLCCGGRVDIAPEEDGADDAPPTRAAPRPATTSPRPSDDERTIALTTRGRPLGLALDATNVYWADAARGMVLKIDKQGGVALPVATGQADPSGVAVSDGVICWTNTGDGTVRTAPVGKGAVVTLASAQAAPRSVTIAGASAYFTTDAWLMRVPLAGGAAVSLKATNGDIPLGQGGVQGITSDGVLIYAAPYQVLWPVDDDCDKPSFAGLCSADWYAGPAMRSGAVDGKSVFTAWGNYWAPGTGEGAISASDGMDMAWLASDLTGPEAIAVDETHVYWVNTGTSASGFTDGSVIKVPRSGGAPSAIAINQTHPVAIAVDESFVFWTNQGSDDVGGSVMRAPK
jgi:hypothetical protein